MSRYESINTHIHNFCSFNYCGVIYFISLSDVDECTTGTHNCQQQCTNTPGSFTCGCNSGYRLLANGYHCQGTCAIGTPIHAHTNNHTHIHHSHKYVWINTHMYTCTHNVYTHAHTHVQPYSLTYVQTCDITQFGQ